MSENSLYSLVNEAQALFEVLSENNGELTPELEAKLTNLEVNLPIKIDAYNVILERAEIEENYWKKKAESMLAVAKGCKNIRERLKEQLKLSAIHLGKSELVGNDVKFKISNSKPKLIVNESEIESIYKFDVVTTEIDKKRITEDLAIGVPVRGAFLEETKSIRSYVNKKLE